ncbi:hypothetical protein N9L68_03190 [bacterium]|nr:hypothetical protein [bacterium]
MKNVGLEILALQETNVNTNSIEVIDGYRFIFSTSIKNKDREAYIKQQKQATPKVKGKGKGKQPNPTWEKGGVGFVFSPWAWKRVKDYNQIDGRIIEVNLRSYGMTTTLINTYCYQSKYEYECKEAHFNNLSSIIENRSRTGIVVLLGDMNVRIEGRQEHEQQVLGQHMFGKGVEQIDNQRTDTHESRQLFMDFCIEIDLVVMNSRFEKPAGI